MGATLDALHRLQTIETQLRAVREQIDSKRRSLQANQRRIAAHERKLADTHEQMRQAQSQADSQELDRRTHEEHIKRLREKLNQSKTNKEYAAILTQLNTDKADALKSEDQALSAMTQVDELKKAEAALRAEIDKEKSRIAEGEAAARALEVKLSAQLGALEAQRDEAASAIPSEVLSTFQRARDKHEGEAMALVEQVHPRRAEYICTGCNMSLTLETINALQTRDEVRMCGSCSRILYLDMHAQTAR